MNALRNKQYRSNATCLPIITVVTVVFNGESYLEETIKSVVNQTYQHIEYIIVDGGSTDGTLDIIRKYEHVIDYWISANDEGIYDAMNKGVELATGEWIHFMNAGDMFFSLDTLMQMFNTDNNPETIIYGDVQVKYPDFFRIKKAGALSKLWRGMQFCHQSVFVRTSYHKLNRFNAANKIAADLEFFYSAYKKGVGFKYKNVIISSVTAGGLSDANRIRAILASRDAVCSTGESAGLNAIYYLFCFDAMFRGWLKKILPRKLTHKIIKMKK